MPNKRIFYASQAVGIDNVQNGGATAFDTTIQGAQSVGINTNFNLEQVFQLGRLDIYDNFPADPDVEVTINKALDGHPLIWNLATSDSSRSIVESANTQCDIILHVDDETAQFINGAPTVAVKMTGCYISSLNYTFPVDGNFTEEIVFVGSDKTTGTTVGFQLTAPTEDPDARVLRRQNFKVSQDTVLPAAISGQCITNVSISASLGREKMFCLGQYAPFHRYVNFPLEITVTFDINQDGNGPSLIGPDFAQNTITECEAANIDKEPIFLSLCDDDGDTVYEFDLGSGCSLQSVSYSGGDTGGGNVTESYTYITYNTLTITYDVFH